MTEPSVNNKALFKPAGGAWASGAQVPPATAHRGTANNSKSRINTGQWPGSLSPHHAFDSLRIEILVFVAGPPECRIQVYLNIPNVEHLRNCANWMCASNLTVIARGTH